jgi:hypothetical protein
VSITGTIAAVAGIGSSIAGGVMQGNAAQDAASAQQKAAQQAQALELQNQQAGVNFQTGEWTGQQAAEQPYQQLGQTSANAYANLLNNPFTPPTLQQAEQTPGYQFNLQQGTQAINENAAATGNLNSGNTGVALEKFGQGLAQNTYQQAYSNALQAYNTNLGAASTGVNYGLNSTGQLGQFGQATANNLSNLYLTGGQQQASQLNNAAAAKAAGDIGSANAYANMFNGITNSATQGLAIANYGSNPDFGTLTAPNIGGPTYMPAPANPYANYNAMAPTGPSGLPGTVPGSAPNSWASMPVAGNSWAMGNQ